jgi:acetyl-CoA hydrolase
MVDLSGVMRAGDGVVCGQACAEPQTLLEALVAQRAALSGCRVFLGAGYSGVVKPSHADHLRLASYGGIGHNRALSDAGVLDVLRVPYSRLAPLIRSGQIRADVVMVQVSPPNARGEHSLGLAADYLIPALEVCRCVVAEVNDQVPWTCGERVLSADDFDLVVESSRAPAQPRGRAPGTLEASIGRHAAAFIPERATLEFGIGTLPEAVCPYLGDRKDLRVHSGTIGDGVAALLRRGAVSRADCAMLIGPPALFEFARENDRIRLRSSEYTHGPATLGSIERFVAVNSAVEVDLNGQVNSEIARGSYVGAIGGAPDFVAAANRSPGGVSLVLVPAARLVAKLSGPATLPAAEAGVVVTELGAADLRGCDERERARRLRAIASAHSAI